MNFDELVGRLEPVFDEAVTSGDDDELFASGYLRGHFDLVVAKLELAEKTDADVLLPAVEASLNATKHELAPTDQQHVKDMLERLRQRATL
ncbi:YfcL protein [Pseudidiomarina planktonica]|uniref:YfcL protein n=1 Tax=Pseudidiomarina planktonica TaxID=1323738 RepID=A0A1Y6ELD2_9GAMM|nr:YfcL family protein [Pseudidiomarina planktonica]RUO65733.1 YfcL family protein [Pseudidiomarina planktonica]SMQ63186.1 YfcL protein [Pseudidiomarina planktonica]